MLAIRPDHCGRSAIRAVPACGLYEAPTLRDRGARRPDVRIERRGGVVTLRRSKIDQTGERRGVALLKLAVEAYARGRFARLARRCRRHRKRRLPDVITRRRPLGRPHRRPRRRAHHPSVLPAARRSGETLVPPLRAGFVTTWAQRGISEGNS